MHWTQYVIYGFAIFGAITAVAGGLLALAFRRFNK